MSNVVDFREWKMRRVRSMHPKPAAKVRNRQGGSAAKVDRAAMVGSGFKNIGSVAGEIVRRLR